MTTTVTPVAAVQAALPTTNPGLAIWNGEPADGLSYVIDSVVASEIIVDDTQSNNTALFVMNNKPPIATPVDAELVIRSLSGKVYGGKARSVATSTTLANNWINIGQQEKGATAIAGSAWEQVDIPLYGRYIIPPFCAFTLTASEITATASTFRFTIRWHELQLPRV